jgi:chromate reductase, NAD(P)H dehydrogenase (quinone)
MTDQLRLLGISGSLREGSYSTAILRSAGKLLSQNAQIDLLPLDQLPLYNEDDDTENPPAAVVELRQRMAAADGLVIVTPEYNHGMSGVLKNALDWASRPYGQSKLTGKPVLTVSSSPAFTGGVRAQAQLNQTLLANAALLVLRPQIVIGLVMDKVKDGELVDKPSLEFLKAGLRDLMRDVGHTASAIQQES